MVDEFSGLKMVAQQSADFDRSKAMDMMETIMQAQPEIDAVFCENDAIALAGVEILVT